MPSRRRQAAWVGIVLGLSMIAVAGLWQFSSEPQGQARPSTVPLVRVALATPGEFQFTVRAHGTVSPRTESELVPQVSGEAVWVSPALAAGGFFEQADPLVRIDRADYEVALETSRATVARAESEHGRAATERERQRRLANRSVASQARIDDAENAFRVSRAVLREALARQSRAERDLERTELRAPYEGRVRSENVDVGQFVQRGTPIARLYAVDFAEIRLPLPDRELAYLDLPLAGEIAAEGQRVGPRVKLRAEFAGRTHSWQGEIVRTEGELDPRSRMLHIVARVADPYGRISEVAAPLAVGLFVEAEIVGRRVADVFVLPVSALRDGNRVYVIDAEDRLRLRDVKVLRTERDQVVIGSGLVAGDRVCVSPLGAVVDGMRVRILDDEASLAGAVP